MQFQIPQFIETEDKIVGPLTLAQFLYAGGAVGTVAALYFAIPNQFLWFLIALPIVALGMSLAFIKINGRSLTKVVGSAFGYFWKPQKYVWLSEQPHLEKSESALHALFGGKFSLESIVAGLALRKAREGVQTSSKQQKEEGKRASAELRERFQSYQKLTGEHRVARRVDYR